MGLQNVGFKQKNANQYRCIHVNANVKILLLECQMYEKINVNNQLLMFIVFVFQMISDLNTFVTKAVPDTRLTLKKYLDVKFEYLVSMLIQSSNTPK